MNCQMNQCTGTIKYKTAGLCHNCYHALNYWKDRSPTAIMRRLNNLELYQSRMEAMAPATPIKKRSKRAS